VGDADPCEAALVAGSFYTRTGTAGWRSAMIRATVRSARPRLRSRGACAC